MSTFEFHFLLQGCHVAAGAKVADIFTGPRAGIGCVSDRIEQVLRHPDDRGLRRDRTAHAKVVRAFARQLRRSPVEWLPLECAGLLFIRQMRLIEKSGG